MTTIVWLKNPLGAPDLPRKRIIADCYAAMNPPERLWRLYLDEVEALRNRNDLAENDYHLLRYSTEARRALTEITLGDADAFSEGTVREVLAVAQRAIRGEAEAALRSAETKLASERAMRLRAELDVQKVLDAAASARETQMGKLRNYAAEIGRWTSLTVMWAGVPLLGLATYFEIRDPSLLRMPPSPEKLLLAVLVGSLTLLSAAGLIWNTPLRSLSDSLRGFVARQAERVLVRYFVVPEIPPPGG
jgi:hypothetical protein